MIHYGDGDTGDTAAGGGMIVCERVCERILVCVLKGCALSSRK